MDGIVILVLFAALAALALVLGRSLVRTRREVRRFDVLHRIAHVSDRGGSLRDTLDAICGIIVPEVADLCTIDLVKDGRVERIAARVGPGGSQSAVERLAARPPSLPAGFGGDPDDGIEPRWLERVSDEQLASLAHDGKDLEFLRGLEARSAITVALTARGKVTGALTLAVAWSGRSFREDDVEFARVLSGRVALTLDNAGLFSDLERAERARAEIAQTLQRGLLPPPLPHVPNWSIAASYRPAGAENEVGGDFYDAFPAAGGWMLVIGDVTGRGASAASVTAQARYTLRTAAALTGDPLVALATLNRALLGRGDAALCSVVALAIREDSPAVRVAVAGHPPPLVVNGEAVEEAVTSGPVLGAFPDAEWELDEVALARGQQLVVLTDGVAEAGRRGSRFGEERLRAELGGVGSPVQAIGRVDGALQAFLGRPLEDDVAVLALSPAGAAGSSADQSRSLALVERLFDAFNRRDAEEVAELCDDRMEFHAVTAQEIGRHEPYVGWEGLRAYLDDVAGVWEELLITPREVEERDGDLLVRGRVYLRSRPLGIRDMPAGWLWSLRDGRFARGEVFVDPDEAVRRFRHAGLRAPSPGPGGSRSMTRLP